MTTPVERPTISVLMLTRPSFVFVLVNLLDVEAYKADGYLVIGCDPESVEEWHAWRARNPVAA